MNWHWLSIEKLVDPGTFLGALALAAFIFLMAWLGAVITTRLTQRARWVMGKLERKVDHTVVRYILRIKNLVIFIVAAILTPPDVISQLMLAGPLLVLYGISIIVAAVVARSKAE